MLQSYRVFCCSRILITFYESIDSLRKEGGVPPGLLSMHFDVKCLPVYYLPFP